jgi:hypothetical protein
MDTIFQEIISLQDRTNINNNNNTNDTNKVSNRSKTVQALQPEAVTFYSSSSEEQSSPERSGIGRPALPAEWKWCKMDLFLNQLEVNNQLKLALSIQNKDGNMVRLMAALNSPFRCFKRGIDNWKINEHYKSVELFVEFLKTEYEIPKKSVNVSKICLMNGRGNGIIPNLSVVHYWLDNQHHIRLYKNKQGYNFVLDDDISHFRTYKNNEVVASKMTRSQEYKKVTMESLGI